MQVTSAHRYCEVKAQKLPLSYLDMFPLIMQSASHVPSWNSQENVACIHDQVKSTIVWHQLCSSPPVWCPELSAKETVGKNVLV